MIFYDVLSAARDGATKTTIRRQLGLTLHQFKERSEFLLTGGYLRKISNIKGVTNYVTTVEGYKLLLLHGGCIPTPWVLLPMSKRYWSAFIERDRNRSDELGL